MSASRIDTVVKSLEKEGFTLSQRAIPFEGGRIVILYVQHLVDRKALSELVIRPLVHHFSRRVPGLTSVGAREVMENILYADDCRLERTKTKCATLSWKAWGWCCFHGMMTTSSSM